MSTVKKKSLDPIEQKKRLGARLKQLRKRTGYSSAEKFAYEHMFSRAAYSKYEQGSSDLNLQYDTLIRLANSFGISLKEFFSEGFD